MKRRLTIALLILAIIAGVCIMLYPMVSSYVNARHASQVIVEYEEVVSGLSEEEKAQIIELADAYNDRLSSSPIVMTDPFDQETVRFAAEGYGDVLDLDGEGLMAYIDIPTIGVHLPIYHGTSSAVLERSVGHLEGSSLPVGGESTHSVLSAHSGLSYARLFTDLEQLEIGDTFSVTVLDEVLTYEVYDIEVVDPTDVSSLNIQEGEDLCTLVTCTPLYINSHRLLVHGTRIPTPAGDVDGATRLAFSWLHLAVGLAAALVASIVLVRQVKRSRRRHKRVLELWTEVRRQ